MVTCGPFCDGSKYCWHLAYMTLYCYGSTASLFNKVVVEPIDKRHALGSTFYPLYKWHLISSALRGVLHTLAH